MVMFGKLWTRYQAGTVGTLALIFVLAIWEVTAALKWIDPFFISSPSLIAPAVTQMWASGVMWLDLRTSLVELTVGFVAAALVGIPMGLFAGWYRRMEYAIDPFVWFWYTVPHTAFYPVLVAWFGLGGATIIIIIFLFTVASIYISAYAGMKNVDPALIRAARSYGATPTVIFRHVALPASIPFIIAGLRLGFGRALIGVVVGEMFGGMAGLGYRLHFSAAKLKTTDFFASIFMIVVLGVVVNLLLTYVEQRFDRWRSA